MKVWLYALLLSCLCLPMVRAQLPTFGNVPVDINSDQTHYENGVAIAEGNVVIQYGDATIYADYGQYHSDTHEAFVLGHVRIFRQGQIFVGERAVYNLETKALHAADFQGDFYPFRFSANSISSIGPKAYLATNGQFTTSDSTKPDYYMQAKTARIYPNDRVIMRNVTLYVGTTPVMWFPYLYQPLRRDMAYLIRPGYYSEWGAFLLTQYNFPITDQWEAKLHVDLRETRGLAVGLDSNYRFGQDDRDWGRFKTYYANDESPTSIKLNGHTEEITKDRYRITLQDRIYLTDDIWANIDINKLSDVRVLRDFLPQEYRIDPQPDNVLSLTKWDPNYTLSLIFRPQLNKFFSTTERLPELVMDVNRHAIAPGSNILYDGESGVALLRRDFATGSATQNYGYYRVDTFHEFLYPMKFWDWLSVVPRAGLRGTFYSQSGGFESVVQDVTVENLLPNNTRVATTTTKTTNVLNKQGTLFRGVVDAGVEASFKFSKEYPNVESRAFGLDDLRHVVQPYMDLSLVATSANQHRVFQVDRYQPSTQLPIFDFPQFTGEDSISNWAVWRLGVRNRLETKRDNQTYDWLQLDSFVDVNIVEPQFSNGVFRQGAISNLNNRLAFVPLPWVGMSVQAQTPINHHGFNEIDSDLTFQATNDLRVSLGHQYIDHNPFFQSSSLVNLSTYYRINDNWGISAREEYEYENETLETQVYELHRDLSSWVASLGFQVQDNGPGGSTPRYIYALLFTLTLKDLPAVSLPFNFDPSSIGNKNP